MKMKRKWPPAMITRKGNSGDGGCHEVSPGRRASEETPIDFISIKHTEGGFISGQPPGSSKLPPQASEPTDISSRHDTQISARSHKPNTSKSMSKLVNYACRYWDYYCSNCMGCMHAIMGNRMARSALEAWRALAYALCDVGNSKPVTLVTETLIEVYERGDNTARTSRRSEGGHCGIDVVGNSSPVGGGSMGCGG